MAHKVHKPEHGGAKKGAGSWGKKAEAKHESSRIRRKQAVKEIQSGLKERENKHEKTIQEQSAQLRPL
jgi:hypothetical protein